jgi:hypothetical protein
VQRVRIEGAWEEWLAFFLEVTGRRRGRVYVYAA